MTKEQILFHLDSHPWSDHLILLETVDSTNTYLKNLARQDAAPHGTVVISDHQTGGKGRLGRSFSSPKGMGIYLSLLLRYDVPPEHLIPCTAVAAEAIRRAVTEVTGLEIGIKWINDLVCQSRKLCGILTEMAVTPYGRTDYLVIGAGLNCGQMPEDFPPDVAPMATSLRQLLRHPVDRALLAAAMIRHLSLAANDLPDQIDGWMSDYQKHCVTIGKDVQLLRGEDRRQAHVDGMDDRGALLVTLSDGTKETIFTGEASIRGMYGYL